MSKRTGPRKKVDPEQVALVMSGRLRVLSMEELEERYNIGGDIPQHAEFIVRIPDGWEQAHPWEGPEENDDGTVTILLEKKVTGVIS